MGLLTSAEQHRLLELLTKIPNIEEPAMRNSLLSGLPHAIKNNVQRVGIPITDLTNLIAVADSAGAQLADDSWPIVQVIENAIQLVDGSRLAVELRQMLADVQARSQTLPQAVPSYPPRGEINTAVLRTLLTAALSSSDLSTLCFDYFRPVYEDFGSGMPKSEKITLLIEYCARNGQLEKLVERIREANPYQYAQFQDQLRKP